MIMTVTPGSRQVQERILRSGTYLDLMRAGARMLEPICGPCVGIGQAPGSGIVSVRTFNRNFPGRSGTDRDQVYLASPATAVATALRGVITDPRELGAEPSLPSAPPSGESTENRHFVFPPAKNEALQIQVLHGPNVVPPSPQIALPEQLSGRVLIVVGDDISTGDLSPDGVVVMSFCSNVAAMANFVFRRLDSQFSTRAKHWGGGFIVGGHNYGQGSSREHAVLAPKYLGVHAVIAKSFARIHRRNLIAQGLIPLTFVDGLDYSNIQQGDEWEIAGLHDLLERGEDIWHVSIAGTSEKLALRAAFTAWERQLLLSGGLLAYYGGTS
ncbi:MAG: hypothetical protein NVS4B12_28830 [Ktedonobacteraceae bacterium]